MSMNSRYLWMNGELVEFEKATIHFLTPALHYGVGVFEGIRSYATDQGQAVFRLREHIQRLVNSVKVLGFRQFPYSVEELAEASRPHRERPPDAGRRDRVPRFDGWKWSFPHRRLAGGEVRPRGIPSGVREKEDHGRRGREGRAGRRCRRRCRWS